MIKYECDNCRQVVNQPEIVDNQGNTFCYSSSEPDIVLFITAAGPSTQAVHFCKACVWKVIRNLVVDFAPGKIKENLHNIFDPRERIEDSADEYLEELGHGKTHDPELSQLQSQGDLPESRPAFGPDDDLPDEY